MNSPIRFAIAALLASSPWPAFAHNLVRNPDFTQWLTDWTLPFGATANVGPDLSIGSPAPPSAHLSGNGVLGKVSIESQCLPADALTSVDFRFDTRVLAGVVWGGIAEYSDADCTDLIDVAATPQATPSQAWTTLALSDLPLVAGTRSVAINMSAYPADGAADGDAYFDHVAFGPAGTLSDALPIDQRGLTGAWYDPMSSGQGLQLTVDPAGGHLFGAWYTYAPAAEPVVHQRWYSFDAAIASDATEAEGVIYESIGGTFAGPPSTTARPVGRGTITFDSCTSGTFAYAFDDGRTGSFALQSLLSQRGCDESGISVASPGPSGLSGTWYDPDTGGQGMMIDVDTSIGAVLLGWYTYAPGAPANDPEGQRWFSAQGRYENQGSSLALDLYASFGGVFDTPFAALKTRVGRAKLNFRDCEHATLEYAFDEGDFSSISGSISLQRLDPAPAGCRLAQ
jgi:hypothetical protein